MNESDIKYPSDIALPFPRFKPAFVILPNNTDFVKLEQGKVAPKNFF